MIAVTRRPTVFLSSFLAVLSLALGIDSEARASPHLFVTAQLDFSNNGLLVFDLATSPPTEFGPFLTDGELGTGPGLDLEVVPSRHVLLISSLQGRKLVEVDVGDPEHPVLLSSLELAGQPTDISVRQDGALALVSIRESPQGIGMVAAISLSPLHLEWSAELPPPISSAVCVSITPDGSAAAVCTLSPSFPVGLRSGVILPGGGIAFDEELIEVPGLVNCNFSPDGRTLLLASLLGESVRIFQNLGNGQLVPGSPPQVDGLPGGQQSVVFSQDGTLAYLNSVNPVPDEVSSLRVVGPGRVGIVESGFAQLAFDGFWGAGFYGAEFLALSPDGALLVAARSTNLSLDPSERLSLIYPALGLSDYIDLGSVQAQGIGILADPIQVPALEIPTLSDVAIVILALATCVLAVARLR